MSKDNNNGDREKFASRLGFILVSAGCAIGLGNVWKFPYICGQNGGAIFIVIYLLCLLLLGYPILTCEFAIGRGSGKSVGSALKELAPKGGNWHKFSWYAYAGNYLLMMFYTVVCGWTIAYFVKAAMGTFDGTEDVTMVFGSMLGSPMELTGWMLLVAVIGFGVCAMGVQKGVERITKVMMAALFVIMALLCVHSLTLEGGQAGLEFYLLPNFDNLFNNPNASFPQIVYAAMSQAMFMLSIGVGSMSIFGSYVTRDRKLTGEAVNVALLDALVAIMAGLIIFPACFAYGISPDAGPGLVFLTLPTVFEQMPLGHLWSTLFFLFVAAAALSSVIAVFEAILRFTMDQWNISRKRAVAINAPILALLSLPCVFGYNIWSDFLVPGIGDVQSLEDFILSNNILPIGCLLFVMFCTTKRGWGWDKFMAEADRGEGGAFPKWTRLWVKYGVPALILIVFFTGWAPTMQTWLGLA